MTHLAFSSCASSRVEQFGDFPLSGGDSLLQNQVALDPPNHGSLLRDCERGRLHLSYVVPLAALLVLVTPQPRVPRESAKLKGKQTGVSKPLLKLSRQRNMFCN